MAKSLVVVCLALACMIVGGAAEEHNDDSRFLLAAEANDLAAVKDLVKKGIVHKHLKVGQMCEMELIKVKNDVGDTALFAAASNGSLAVVEYLLTDLGYGINDVDTDGAMPIHVAAWHGHTNVVEYLLGKGADINVNCENGWTPLLGAARWGELEMVKFLQARGAWIDKKGENGNYSPLMIASMHGHLDVVKYLLEQKVDADVRDPHGRNALQLARENGFKEIVEVLEKALNYAEL